MDVLEIDAASNNGVENIRDLRDDAIYTPSQVKMRVYIIDEVHMLSISAFNALLKIVEEPPKHLIFILATTELHKVPATILSRCQRFSFRRISQEDIAGRLQYVAYQENIDLDDSAARVLARLADGALRDGLSLLDQCASATTGELSAQQVYNCLGIAGLQQCATLMTHIAAHDTAKALSLLSRLYADGKDLSALLDELASLARDLLVIKTAPKEGITMLSGIASEDEVIGLSKVMSVGELSRIMSVIQLTLSGMTKSVSRRTDVELCLISLCQPEMTTDMDALLARLTRIEEQIATGNFVAQTNFSIEDAFDTHLPKEHHEDVVVKTTNVQPQPEARQEPVNEAPVGFWSDIAAAVRAEMKTPASGFFTTTQDAPVNGILHGNTLTLSCTNKFTMEIINKPDICELVARKASAKLGRKINVVVTDRSGSAAPNVQMESLLDFGRAHADRINIKD